ncbi:MAG: glycoside hydrolase family 2 [Rudaea sp.]
MRVQIGQASHLLTGPWRFRLGDDPRWAAPGFDASGWEIVDLTPAPGAHDGDVGLTNYVPGWSARGHKGYSGYAWYRMRVVANAPAGTDIALLAPANVEDVYQLYWNGTLIGGSGDFSGNTPVIYSSRPQVFHVPLEGNGMHDAVIAIRVWMRPGMGRGPDAGGIHIPPMLGTSEGIHAQYQSDWLETFNGYVVEVAEPLAFVLLALLAWCFRSAISPGRFVPWLCAALLLTAAYRLNQAVYAWMPYESLSVYIVVHYSLIPLGLAAWIMAWRHFYQLERWRWLSWTIGAIALLSVALVLTTPHTYVVMRPVWRIPLAIFLFAIAIIGLRKPQPDRLLTFIVVLLVAASQFSVLEALGVPGIWFPFGVGVSLTQYVYAALIVSLAVMLIRRVQREVANQHARIDAVGEAVA